MIFSIDVLTAYPEMFPGSLGFSVIGRALYEKKWHLNVMNLRDGAIDKRGSIDDYPYGGGAGMVFRPDVVENCFDKLTQGVKIFHMSPRGRILTQHYAHEIIQHEQVAFLCSRFEGVDQRVLDYYQVEEVSLGEFVLSSGDLAAQVLIDCCVRLLPGILGNEESIKFESFSPQNPTKIEHDLYTRPETWRGISIPEVLKSGHHAKIAQWKKENGALKTLQRNKKFNYF